MPLGGLSRLFFGGADKTLFEEFEEKTLFEEFEEKFPVVVVVVVLFTLLNVSNLFEFIVAETAAKRGLLLLNLLLLPKIKNT